jgi:hypothetical protein
MLKRIERNTPSFKADVVIKRRHTADCKTSDGKRTSEAIDCPPLERRSDKQDKCPLFLTGYVNGRRIRHHSLRSREIDLAIIEANRRLDELETGIQQPRPHDTLLAKAREMFFLDGIRTRCSDNLDANKTPEERIQEAISLYDTFRKQNDLLRRLITFTTKECQPPIYYLVDISKEVLEKFEHSWKGAPKCHKRIKISAKEHEQRCDGKYEYKPKTLNGKGTYQQTPDRVFRLVRC